MKGVAGVHYELILHLQNSNHNLRSITLRMQSWLVKGLFLSILPKGAGMVQASNLGRPKVHTIQSQDGYLGLLVGIVLFCVLIWFLTMVLGALLPEKSS